VHQFRECRNKKKDFSLINDTYDRAKLTLAMIHLALMPISVYLESKIELGLEFD